MEQQNQRPDYELLSETLDAQGTTEEEEEEEITRLTANDKPDVIEEEPQIREEVESSLAAEALITNESLPQNEPESDNPNRTLPEANEEMRLSSGKQDGGRQPGIVSSVLPPTRPLRPIHPKIYFSPQSLSAIGLTRIQPILLSQPSPSASPESKPTS